MTTSSVGAAVRGTTPAPVAAASVVNATDLELASLVQQSIRELAKVSPTYVSVFANRPGARLAGQVRAGYVDRVSQRGRTAMQRVYTQTQAASAVRPGLDTNTLVDRVTGRRDPRSDRSR